MESISLEELTQFVERTWTGRAAPGHLAIMRERLSRWSREDVEDGLAAIRASDANATKPDWDALYRHLLASSGGRPMTAPLILFVQQIIQGTRHAANNTPSASAAREFREAADKLAGLPTEEAFRSWLESQRVFFGERWPRMVAQWCCAIRDDYYAQGLTPPVILTENWYGAPDPSALAEEQKKRNRGLRIVR